MSGEEQDLLTPKRLQRPYFAKIPNLHSQQQNTFKASELIVEFPTSENGTPSSLRKSIDVQSPSSNNNHNISSPTSQTTTTSSTSSSSYSGSKPQQQHYKSKYSYFASSSNSPTTSSSNNAQQNNQQNNYSPRKSMDSTPQSPPPQQQQQSQQVRVSIRSVSEKPTVAFQRQFIHKETEISKQGWLFCSFIYASNFMWRWVVLTPKQIYAYSDSQAVETLSLQSGTIRVTEDSKQPIFTVSTSNNKKYYFIAKSTFDSKDWAGSIFCEIYKGGVNERLDESEEYFKNQVLKYAEISNTPASKTMQQTDSWRLLLVAHVNLILNQKTHRFGQVISKFVAGWQYRHRKLLTPKSTITEDQFNQSVGEIKTFISQVISALDTFYGFHKLNDETVFFTCQSVVEEILFSKLSKDVAMLFRKRYKEDDENYLKKRKELLTISAAHLGIKQIFWLLPDDLGPAPTEPPYTKAINLIQTLPNLENPSKKINCLTETAKEIVQSIHDHWKDKLSDDKLAVGGDDLVPLMAFVLIRAGVPNLVSECSVMEYFINEELAMQQGGYLVATLQTCLSLIGMIDHRQMFESASEVLSKIIRERDKERDFLKERAERELLAQQHKEASTPIAIAKASGSPPDQLADITLEKLEQLLAGQMTEEEMGSTPPDVASPARSRSTTQNDSTTTTTTTTTTTSQTNSTTPGSPLANSNLSDQQRQKLVSDLLM